MLALNLSVPSKETIRTVALAYGALCGTAQQLQLDGKHAEADMIVYAARLFRNSTACEGVLPAIFEDIHAQFLFRR
jgi:hypothetical protein